MTQTGLVCDPESIRDWPEGYVYAQVPLWQYGIDLSCWQGLVYTSSLEVHEVAWAAPLVYGGAQSVQHSKPSSSSGVPPCRTSRQEGPHG